MSVKKPKIVLGVTGSIAAYKACELVRQCAKAGWEVSVIMTRAATRFVGEVTYQTLSRNPVAVEMFDSPEEWQPDHISLADSASVFVIAPCTANVIAKLAVGLADDLLTSTALATQAPILIAPAMNVHMWEHPATQNNIEMLRARGAVVMEAGKGDLACGYEGQGRMPEPSEIMNVLRNLIEARYEV